MKLRFSCNGYKYIITNFEQIDIELINTLRINRFNENNGTQQFAAMLVEINCMARQFDSFNVEECMYTLVRIFVNGYKVNQIATTRAVIVIRVRYKLNILYLII